jgi:DNA-binding MurR/RpiR family transcriptional regulator
MRSTSLEQAVASSLHKMSPAEQRVARMFMENREEVLFVSAASLAAKAGTSDATVIRTVKTLGFKGMDELRKALATEIRESVSISSRLSETLREVGDDPATALTLTLDIHCQSIEKLRNDISSRIFKEAVKLLGTARRIVLFGIGPSSALATYFATQLNRFGLEAACLVRTGLLLADDLRQLRQGDVLFALAYTHVYRELAVLLTEADRNAIKKILVTDSLAGDLHDRVDLILPVARGRANMLSMHAATLTLIEALLVGIAARSPKATLKGLESLNALREQLVGQPMDIGGKSVERRDGSGRQQRRNRSRQKKSSN